MIAAFVVLLVIALGLGGYIVYAEVSKRRKIAYAAEDEAFERVRNYIASPSSDSAVANRSSADGATIANEVLNTADRAEDGNDNDEAELSGNALNKGEVRDKVTASEVDALMKDEVAASLIEKSDVTSDKTKIGIVNIDALSQYFESGETVTLDEVKKRVKGFNKQTTYLKVLARGTLDKKLTVEADSFSLQAVKMIVLTGGSAVIKQSKTAE